MSSLCWPRDHIEDSLSCSLAHHDKNKEQKSTSHTSNHIIQASKTCRHNLTSFTFISYLDETYNFHNTKKEHHFPHQCVIHLQPTPIDILQGWSILVPSLLKGNCKRCDKYQIHKCDNNRRNQKCSQVCIVRTEPADSIFSIVDQVTSCYTHTNTDSNAYKWKSPC